MPSLNIIRNELSISNFKFDGSFDHDRMKTSVVSVLLSLVNMLQEGNENFDSKENKLFHSCSANQLVPMLSNIPENVNLLMGRRN